MNIHRIARAVAAGVFLAAPFVSSADGKKQPASKTGATHVQAAEAARLVEENKVTVLDIRTPAEYQGGHIKGAKNIDFNAKDFESQIQVLDKSKPYLVRCQGGGRSSRSLKLFQKLGFEKIYHLDGGISSWEDAGKPLEK